MNNVTAFPRLYRRLIPLETLPPGHAYKHEAPDWIVRKTTDGGKTWVEIGYLDPPRKPKVDRG
jgi:hypothetical protein